MKKLQNISINYSFISTFLLYFTCLSTSLFTFAQTESEQYQDNQILLRFQDFAPQGDIAKMADDLSADILKYYPLFNAQLWQVADTSYVDNDTLIGVAEVVDYYQYAPFVDYVEPNQFYELQATPNDYNASQLWGLAKIEAPAAWDTRTSSSDVVVGILDTGIDYDHPDLQANVWTNPNEILNGLDDDGNGYIDDIRGWDFSSDNDGDSNIEGDNDPFDDWSSGHGTHVSGTIGAVGNNGIGITGVNWEAQIMPLKVFSPNNGPSTTAAILAEAIQYAVMMKVNYGINVQMTNNSWGGGGYSNLIAQAVDASENAGQLFIAAAGNFQRNNDVNPFYPASYSNDNIIAVASTDSNDDLSSFSHFGATTVDVGAPGRGIYSTLPNNNYGNLSGTSMASPHVTGVAALLWAENPSWTAAQVKERILCSADLIPALTNKCVSEGRLNANHALNISAPDATFSYTVNGNSVDFVANNVESGVSYSWDFGDGNESSEGMPVHTYEAGGEYNVCLIVDTKCGQATSCQLVSVNIGNCVGEESWRQYLNGSDVTALASIGDVIFVGTDKGGLIKINTVTNEKTFYNSGNSDLPENQVNTLFATSTSEIFIGTGSSLSTISLAKFDGTSATGWEIYDTNNSDLPGFVYSLAENSIGEILVGTNNGLAKFDGISSTEWEIYNTNNSGLPSNLITDLLVSSSEAIFMATKHSLTKFDGTNWVVYDTINSDLPDNSNITSLLEDNVGNIFVGTNKGLAKFDGINYNNWTIFNEINSGLVSNSIIALSKNSIGDIFIAQSDFNVNNTSDSPNVSKFNGDNFNGWTSYTPHNSDLPNLALFNIIEHRDNIVLGFFLLFDNNIGVMEFDGTNHRGWISYDTNPSDFSFSIFSSSLVSSSNKLFMGTQKGLICFDGISATNWTIYDTINSDLPSNQIYSLIESSSGEIFIGTNKGLAKFDGISSTEWIIYDSNNSELPHNAIINDLIVNNSREIFIGTQNHGLIKFDGISSTGWTTYNQSNSDLPSNQIHNLLNSNSGEIFVNTEKGLAKFNGTNTPNWTVYNSYNSDIVDIYERSIIFAGQKHTFIEQMNNEIFIGGFTGIGVLSNSNITASFSYPTISCASSAITFTNTSQNATSYEWQIDGTTISTDTDLTHTFSQTGTYIITLIASNGDDCTESYSQTITVHSTAHDLELGNDTTICGTSFTLQSRIPDMNLYAWDYEDAAGNHHYMGDTENITINQSGPYSLVVGDQCNNFVGDTIIVTFADAPNFDLGNDTTICGNSLLLDAGTWSSYLWSTGETTPTITVTKTGVYTVTVTNADGCTASDHIIVTFSSPSAIDLGDDLIICATDTILNAGVANSYLWSTGETTPIIVVSTTGNYSVTVTNADGCSASDEVYVYFDNNCVWPGDANYDGVVTNIDILYIGLANGTSDIPRPNATINWQAEACEDWNNSFPNGINHKHGDTDGNSIINITDTTAVGQNYGFTHSGNPVSTPNNTPAPTQLTPTLTDCFNTSNNGYAYKVGLDLAQANSQPVEAYGLAFSLSYNTDHISDIGVDFSNSWLNNDNSGLLTFVRHFPAEGRMDITLSRINQTITSGSGSLVEIEPLIDNVPINEAASIEISVNWVRAVLPDASPIAVEGNSLSETVPFGAVFDLGEDLFSCATEATLDAGIDDVEYLWSTGETTKTITINQSDTYELTVTNAYGCSVSDDIEVIVNEDCVFPGDVNYDGIATNADLMPFGFVQGQTGPIRPNATTDWVGQPCQNWGIHSPHTVDTKHADTDGNGMVDHADRQAIFTNYSRQHANNTTTNRLVATAQFTTEVVTPPSRANGGLLEMDIYLSDNGQATPVYGTYFSIDYTAAFANANILFNESALGTTSTDMYTLHKDFPNDHAMDIALVRIDLNNAMVSTQQAIARFQAYVIHPIDTSVQINIDNGYVIDNTNMEEALATTVTSPIDIIGTTAIALNLQALLSGAFDPINNHMHNTLQAENLLPTQQPFHTAPWNYQGNEGVLQTADLPAGMVDWVLVDIRNEQQQIVTQRAAALLQTGQIVDVFSELSVDIVALSGLLEGNTYQLILRHRSHVDVLSTAFTITNLAATLDLTNPNQVVGSEQQVTELSNGQYGLIVGDFNGDGIVNVKDYNRMAGEMGTSDTYSDCDADLDGHILTNDFNIYQPNASHIGVGLIRY